MLQQPCLNIFSKLFCVLILQRTIQVNCEFYSSLHQMTKLVDYEHNFLQDIQKFIGVNEQKLNILKAHLLDFERERDEALQTGPSYFESPVNQNLLNKRLTVDWPRIENLMASNVGEKYLNSMDEYKMKHQFPDDSELNGAIEGFLRLQDIYRLKSVDMAAGTLQGVTYPIALHAHHCFDIGKLALKQKKLKLAHSWLIEALQRLSNETHDEFLTNKPLEKFKILLLLARTKHKLGDLNGANATYTELLYLQPNNKAVVRAYTKFTKRTKCKDLTITKDLSEEHEPLPANVSSASQSDRYKLTCGGHITTTPSDERYLRCRYQTGTQPFLRIAPFKVEKLNHDPLLVIYHDVLSDKEIEVLKQIAEGKIERSSVLSENGSTISKVRVSHFAFIDKTLNDVFPTIDKRVEDMTNLNMDYADQHQFSNYGIGGHYSEHYDYFFPVHIPLLNEQIRKMGNRIATVLFYLSDVEQGGGTAFPYLKRLLMPKKGSAAFWYNLHASGDPDERTLHGACPIIVGSKWVQNRWIYENDQSDRRPCEVFNDRVYGPF